MSVEKELGALQEGLKNISNQLDKAEAGRKHLYERVESMDRKVDHLSWKVENIETRLTSISPTIEKVERVQMQAEGAGKFGVFLSRAGMILLSIGSAAISAWITAASYLK